MKFNVTAETVDIDNSERVEMIDTETNSLFTDCKSESEIRDTYESFWNDTVFVSQVHRIDNENIIGSYAPHSYHRVDLNKMSKEDREHYISVFGMPKGARLVKNGGITGMIYTLSVFSDDVRVSYGDVCDFFDGVALIDKANEWAGKDNWNRLELTIEEGQVLPIKKETDIGSVL